MGSSPTTPTSPRSRPRSTRLCRRATWSALYAVKHNPFAYFRDVQEGVNPRSSLKNMVDFDGAGGLYADLASGDVPNLLVHRSQPVQRSAWTRQCRGLLQLRSQRQRHAGGPQSGPHLSRRCGREADRHRHPHSRRHGATAATPSCSSGTKTTTAPRPIPTRCC